MVTPVSFSDFFLTPNIQHLQQVILDYVRTEFTVCFWI